MNPDADPNSADLRFFVTVARRNSLAAAARELDVSRSAVTQRLRPLEERLKCVLIERSTRHLRLTEAGQIILARGQAVLDELDSIAESLSLRRKVVGGHLRIAAPLGFGRRYIAPALACVQDHRHEALRTILVHEMPAAQRGVWLIGKIGLQRGRSSKTWCSRSSSGSDGRQLDPGIGVRHSYW